MKILKETRNFRLALTSDNTTYLYRKCTDSFGTVFWQLETQITNFAVVDKFILELIGEKQ